MKSGVKTTHLRLSAREAINRIRAERNNPHGDLVVSNQGQTG